MGYAVELFINEHEATKLRETISAIGSVMADIDAAPHVSLAVFDDVDVDSLVSVVADFVRRTPKIVLQFSSVGMFPGRESVLFLAPVVTRDLLVIHTGLHQDLAELGLFADANYRPGKWVPHCTLSMEQPLEKTLEGMCLVAERGLLGTYLADSIHVVRFRPVVTLAEFALHIPPRPGVDSWFHNGGTPPYKQ